jgi:DNA end-binding protein Ku
MWKGSVAFGLVNVPIKLYSATEDHDVRFHQVHAADGGRIKMQRICSVDGQPVDYKDLAKAYETDGGQTVVMDEADFEGLPVPGVREIEVLEFVPSEQVDPVLFDRSYYLEPDSHALKPYVLLRQALEQTERTAIVRVVLRSKTQLGALRVRGDVLVLQTMLWADEVRNPSFDVLDGEIEVRPQELQMAASLIDSLSADFDPDQYEDEYRAALLAVIEAKLAGGAGVVAADAGETPDAGEGLVLDLMAALRESVQRTKAERAASADGTAAASDAPVSAPEPAVGPSTSTAATSEAAKPSAAKSKAKKSTAAKATPKKSTAKIATKPSTSTKAATKSATKAAASEETEAVKPRRRTA